MSETFSPTAQGFETGAETQLKFRFSLEAGLLRELSSDIQRTAVSRVTNSPELKKLVTSMRRAALDIKAADCESDDPLDIDLHLDKAKLAWMHALELHEVAPKDASDFLFAIMIPLSSSSLLAERVCRLTLANVISEFADLVNGCTSKDIERWRDEIRSVGLSFSTPIAAE